MDIMKNLIQGLLLLVIKGGETMRVKVRSV